MPDSSTTFQARRGDGVAIHPGDGVVPIMKRIAEDELAIVGTGFYVTRYGLVATAKHVVEELTAEDGSSLVESCVCHLNNDNATVHLRPILRAHSLKAADIAVLQVDNFLDTSRGMALKNLRAKLCTLLPIEGSPLVTYAYPENKTLDFSHPDNERIIAGDYFHGGFLRFVDKPEHPFLRFPYLETSVEVRSGASGGPVFDPQGRVIGVNSRSWDFRGGEHEGRPLSYIVPIGFLLDLQVDAFLVPPFSWEGKQIPEDKLGKALTGRELANLGHLQFEPPLPGP